MIKVMSPVLKFFLSVVLMSSVIHLQAQPVSALSLQDLIPEKQSKDLSYCTKIRNFTSCTYFLKASVFAQLHVYGLRFSRGSSAENAKRHALWAAMMAWYMDPQEAQGFLDRHEVDDQTSRDHFADLHNNAVGKAIGIRAKRFSSSSSARSYILREVNRAYQKGQLDLNCDCRY